MEDQQGDNNRKNSYINRAFDGMVSKLDGHHGKFEIAINHENPSTEPAVQVHNAFKTYTTGGVKKPILHNLNMTVKKGTIYSLLGSSGCGKTTLLTCVVGIKRFDSGEVRVFGAKAGTRRSGVPGRKIGYMPQDIALYKDFTIGETVTYFGNLYGMNRTELETNRKFLADLLSLPEDSRRVSSISGGQQRRVSLAVALVHCPPLIILDEPTVGVDPLLRESIWKHLSNLVSDGRTTVIVTTHYIDEAAYSDQVGVMRGGRLLTEKTPKALYDEFKTTSLQDVVLKLCHTDESTAVQNGRSRSKSSGNILTVDFDSTVNIRRISSGHDRSEDSCCFSKKDIRDSLTRIRSLTMKNMFVMFRNLLLVAFVILMPAIQVLLMGMSMGNDPRSMKVGVVNHELNISETCNFGLDKDESQCEVSNLSCRFLSNLPNDTVQLINYLSEKDAREDVKDGKLRGFMKFPKNYSEYMYERSTAGVMVENEVLEGSVVSFEMDASNTIITKSLQRIIYESYNRFIKALLTDCGLSPELGGIPVRFENPIYGQYDLRLQDFVAAGMVVGVALFYPLCSSSITFIWDKKQGTMDRARVAGAQTSEIILSFFITEGCILILQTAICMFAFVMAFDIKIQGSLFLASALVTLNGFAGISLGLFFGAICSDEIQAILLSLAIMIPNFFLAGAIYPVEAMPMVLQHLSNFLPGTLACEAFRSIVVRGWGITYFAVYAGFLSTFSWLVFYWIVNIFVHRVTLARK